MPTFEEFITEKAELLDKDIIRLAEERGYVIHKPRPQEIKATFDTSRLRGKRVRLGIYSDTHLGSKYQQLQHLHHFVAYATKEARVDALVICGDITDGPPQMHPGHLHNIFLHTYDAQRAYAIENLPRTKLPTYVISGNHDESWLKNNAGDIVQDICHERDDLTWVGQSNGTVAFGDILVFLTHPHDGGSYALSYKLQRRIEQLSPENKPHLYLAGNYHKACHLPAYRNVDGFLLPAYQAQTPFMAGKGLPSVIGGLILEFGLVATGLAPSFKTEWVLERQAIPNDWS